MALEEKIRALGVRRASARAVVARVDEATARMIDGLLRLGAVLPEDPQYLDLLRLMKP